MTTPRQLLKRMDAIGDRFSQRPEALALLGLGSVGTELDRLDEYSDLDFFVIVRQGFKQSYIHDLDWLAVQPIAYSFMNTVDGYKLLYEDGIFCEFAVFEPQEMASIPFSAGRIVWKAVDFDESVLTPYQLPSDKPKPADWLLGEAITNIYVGLGRFWRGEKLSAARFIQGYAVDRVVELAAYIETAQPAYRDIFTPERRFEKRFPGVAGHLTEFVQGYEHSPESALAILTFLEKHFEVNPALAAKIRALAGENK
ncbi:MAG: hypothetical protein R3E39_15585 [Anaerolineae bacterium]